MESLWRDVVLVDGLARRQPVPLLRQGGQPAGVPPRLGRLPGTAGGVLGLK